MASQLDAILTHLGTGKWSIVHFIVAAYISVFLVPHTLGGAFLAPRLDYSCREPTTTTTTYTTTTTATITSNVSIHQQANSSSVANEAKCEYRIDTPDGERIEECVEFNFDNSTFSSTFTSEYNLACGRGYLQTSFQSVYMLGIFVGAPVNGYLSDKYGRKPMIVGGVVSYLILGVASAWLPLLSTILVARFLLGFAHAISCYTSYVLMVEVMEPKMRISAGYVVYTFWAFATMLYGFIGYFLRDWRILQTVLTLPGLLILPVLWLIDESPRWLIVNGRREEALQVLGKVARWHGVDLPPEEEMKTMVQEQASEVQVVTQRKSLQLVIKTIASEVMVLVRTPRLRIITVCVFLDYLIAAMVFFGLSLSGASVSDNPFVYMVLSGLAEIPAYTLTIPVVQHFGRKHTLSVFFLISAVVLFGLAIIPAVYTRTVVALAIIGKMAITGGFQTVIFFSSELFPTEVRSRGVGISFMMSRIGSMVSPFIMDLLGFVYPWAPFVVFGSGALLAGAGTFLLPETLGQTLPDTVAQLEEKVMKAPKQPNELQRVLKVECD